MQQSNANSSAATAEQHWREQLELLRKSEADPSSTSPPPQDHKLSSPQPDERVSNGYDALTAASEATRALSAKTEADSFIHPDLRAVAEHSPPVNMISMTSPPSHSPVPAPAGPTNPNLAPAPAQPTSEDDGINRKAKRELSQSKRAAQNRAAQRAFRQRKEGYIKKLEQQVRDYADVEESLKALQSENYALREYVIHLQSRLADIEGEFPQPPPNVNLSQSVVAPPSHPGPMETVSDHPGAGTPLEAVAQAVAGLAAQEQIERQQSYSHSPFTKTERSDDENRSADEMKHLQAADDGGPSTAV